MNRVLLKTNDAFKTFYFEVEDLEYPSYTVHHYSDMREVVRLIYAFQESEYEVDYSILSGRIPFRNEGVKLDSVIRHEVSGMLLENVYCHAQAERIVEFYDEFFGEDYTIISRMFEGYSANIDLDSDSCWLTGPYKEGLNFTVARDPVIVADDIVMLKDAGYLVDESALCGELIWEEGNYAVVDSEGRPFKAHAYDIFTANCIRSYYNAAQGLELSLLFIPGMAELKVLFACETFSTESVSYLCEYYGLGGVRELIKYVESEGLKVFQSVTVERVSGKYVFSDCLGHLENSFDGTMYFTRKEAIAHADYLFKKRGVLVNTDVLYRKG